MKKRIWVIPFICTGIFLLAYAVLFCVALSNPTWEGPWGRYSANASLIGAAVCFITASVLLSIYLVRKKNRTEETLKQRKE